MTRGGWRFFMVGAILLAAGVLLVCWWLGRGDTTEEGMGASPAPPSSDQTVPLTDETGPMVRPLVRLRGHVFSTSGAPAPGAVVLLRPSAPSNEADQPDLAQCVCDDEGFYSFLPSTEGRYTLSAVADGFVPQERTAEVEGSEDVVVDFHLEQFATVSGAVASEGGVDTERVNVFYTHQGSALQHGAVPLDRAATFSQLLPPGEYVFGLCVSFLHVGADSEGAPYGRVPFSVRRGSLGPVALKPGEDLVDEYELTLREGERIYLGFVVPNRSNRVAGQVIVADTGVPVPRAVLSLRGSVGTVGEAVSDEQGRFSMEHLPLVAGYRGDLHIALVGTPNPYDALVDPEPVYLGQTDAVVRIQREVPVIPCLISGKVIDRQTRQGLGGAVIRFIGGSVKPPVVTEGDGTFELTNTMVPGHPRHALYEVDAAGYMRQYFPQKLDSAAPPEEPLVFPLDRATGELEVCLHLPPGGVPADVFAVTVQLVPVDPESWKSGGVQIEEWVRSGPGDTSTPPLNPTARVAAGSYKLYTIVGFSPGVSGADGDNSGKTSYVDTQVVDVTLGPGRNRRDVQVCGNATLELILPDVPLKDLSGRLWHTAELQDHEDAWDRLMINNGQIQFTPHPGAIDGSASVLASSLPAGTRFLQVFGIAQTGETLRDAVPVELRDGMVTTVEVNWADASDLRDEGE